ncbi:ABC transporter ATP-binding protein [Eoetvoesiella caeni]|uniref:NitT/TauT family transport system ATP-binding protein n=1 Tax=Eoetvoesiella caeni TaxID=645616 RepID=A0A366HL55_9BURK|nr:ABC transporter ATP-binding protein [Eoetvoesiella caeni]MCI2807550.1 ABC transporter ATP-binding protein [Eoetvoesiella caeni]NYT53055.1 ABC transporter ATP-binding protein [Eoetvoesiella caeni]RBP43032.1 NitT/TauT family transport system ATP-binding protein [Eoetvoesiella caeni]
MVEIEFRDVGKSFVDKQTGELRPAVSNISLSIAKGEVVSLIGPSGCGKSTLLNMGSGIYAPTSGQVFIAGQQVTKPVREVAFMLQKDLLMQWRTIEDNVALGLEIAGVDKAERLRIANELLVKCHLRGFEKHYPYQLSGGMRQRAALARTLAVDPQVMLLDEPFSALDAQTKMILQQDLAKMLYEKKRTALFITHDLVEGIALSDRLLVMSERPGTIIEEIIIDLPLRDNPLERRKLPEIGPLQGRLMDLLKIGKEEDAVLH